MSAIIKEFTVNARYDLQAPSVQIFYETTNTINGQPSLSLVTDFYPDPLPADPASQFAALQFTVDLQGTQSSFVLAKIACDPLVPTDANWWLGKHPQYRPYQAANPADANNSILSFAIDPTSIERAANPSTDIHGNPITDQNYTSELTTGQLTDWMPFQSQRITIRCKATVVHRNGTQPQEIPLTFQCLSTNATTGTFQNQEVNAYAEPVPAGLAQHIYEAISVLQFEGELALQEPDVTGLLGIGKVFNLTGGALPEWTTMNAMVQGVSEDLDAGVTRVRFGPPRNLSAGDLVDLLRVNRTRLVISPYSMRSEGTSTGSGNVDLGQNTPEKNSVSGTTPLNPHVISASVDGSGAVIKHLSDGTNCTSQWIGNAVQNGPPPPGSITIQLSDAGGQDLSIQKVSLCQNGVQGSMYLLCSGFVPDDDGD